MADRCINPRCGEEIKDGWAFCSFCGMDNRRPSLRFPVPDCEHQIERGEFCVQCGHSALDEDPHSEETQEATWREWAGWGLLLGGIALVIVSQILRQGAYEFERNSTEYLRHMNRAYGFGRLAFIMIPAGVALVVFFGRRWKIFKNR